MQSIFSEIIKLRGENSMNIDCHNRNPYCVVFCEQNRSKTAYYFSTPIYNRQTRKLIDLQFHSDRDSVYMTGSNGQIALTETLRMQNTAGTISMALPQKAFWISPREVRSGPCLLLPTTNGIAIRWDVRNSKTIQFVVEIGQSYVNIRSNDRYIAFMQETFKPFAVISCIGSTAADGHVIAPAKIMYQKLTDTRYLISLSATSPLAQYILFELNLYEHKLFQDTTVESMNPITNNAFGSVGYIGNTSIYGEQWLYSKADYEQLSELWDKRIRKVILHIPQLNRSNVELRAFRVAARFCSFGSNWNNKISERAPVSDSLPGDGYQHLDVTSLFVNPATGTMERQEGIIMKSKIKDSGFSVIATGDSMYAPQIMEICYC